MTLPSSLNAIQPIQWRDDCLYLLDQRLLPQTERYLALDNCEDVAKAITDMVVRGAPAIGITAAYGVVLAARNRYAKRADNWREGIETDLQTLAQARPTAVNLRWALDVMTQSIEAVPSGDNPESSLLQLAQQIHEKDIRDNQRMGDLGAEFLQADSRVLTHCNAGALATGGYGTALGVIRSGWRQGRIASVYADETRPWMQGARLTAWELIHDGIPVSLSIDGAAAWLMQQRGLDWVIVGSDRIAANGDVANKIGTYQLAIAARHHGVGFMVVAPTSTIDMSMASGGDIPIEERDATEVLQAAGQRVAAEDSQAWNPVFDVTPAELINVLVTERGVIECPTIDNISAMML